MDIGKRRACTLGECVGIESFEVTKRKLVAVQRFHREEDLVTANPLREIAQRPFAAEHQIYCVNDEGFSGVRCAMDDIEARTEGNSRVLARQSVKTEMP